MIYYAHRGNVNGPDKSRENRLSAIKDCLSKSIRVEIDVIVKDGQLFLGHDEPQEPVTLEFLARNFSMLLIHCKTIDTVKFLNQNYIPFLHYFFHEDEPVVGTSLHYLVHHQNSEVKEYGDSDIVVDLEKNKIYSKTPYAVVTDFVVNK